MYNYWKYMNCERCPYEDTEQCLNCIKQNPQISKDKDLEVKMVNDNIMNEGEE